MLTDAQIEEIRERAKMYTRCVHEIDPETREHRVAFVDTDDVVKLLENLDRVSALVWRMVPAAKRHT